MQLLFRASKNWALQVHVAKDNSILGDDDTKISLMLPLNFGLKFVVYFAQNFPYSYFKEPSM